MQTLLFVIDKMSEMECSSMVGSDSTCSFDESANFINDCYNNMVQCDTNEVSGLEETVVVAPLFEEIEELSINSGDLADFAQGVAQSEAGRAVEVFKEERNLEEEMLVSDKSEASSEFFTPLQLARIEAINDAGRAVEVFKEEGNLEEEMLDSDKSVASSEFFTPLQLARIEAINVACRARNEENEYEAFQNLMLADLSITQCSGYGAFNANYLIPRVIAGLEPKVPWNQLIRNWLNNEKNSFEISFYPF